MSRTFMLDRSKRFTPRPKPTMMTLGEYARTRDKVVSFEILNRGPFGRFYLPTRDSFCTHGPLSLNGTIDQDDIWSWDGKGLDGHNVELIRAASCGVLWDQLRARESKD